jgi:hypothetical protein
MTVACAGARLQGRTSAVPKTVKTAAIETSHTTLRARAWSVT